MLLIFQVILDQFRAIYRERYRFATHIDDLRDVNKQTSVYLNSPHARMGNSNLCREADETVVLAGLVGYKRATMKGKFGPNVTSQPKRKEWTDIAAHRTPKDCERRYTLQSKARQKIFHLRRHHRTRGKEILPELNQNHFRSFSKVNKCISTVVSFSPLL